MLPVIETPELVLEMEAAQIVLRWRGQVSRPVSCRFKHGGLECRLWLIPDDVAIPVIDPTSVPTPCERDIIDVIRSAGKRLKQPEIFKALETAGKLHGESTIVKALARMVKDGRLSQTGRRGYVTSDQLSAACK